MSLDEDTRRRLLKIARADAERLARLVDDLLDFERLERGTMQLELAPVELEPVVDRAAAIAGLPQDREIEVDLPRGLAARADEGRLLQVLTNLLANAAEHGAGTVRVMAGERDGRVEVAGSDDGPGIAREHLPELFLPFARWSRRRDSTGLGLAIARGIAHAHGGTLVYEPGENGGRHAFVLTLPKA